MVVILPCIVLVLLLLTVNGMSSHGEEDCTPLQGVLLSSFAIWGMSLVLLTELLSQVNGLSRWPLAGGWVLGVIVLLATGVRTSALSRGYQKIVASIRTTSSTEKRLIVALGSLLLVLAAVSIAAPTNNVDAMDYHMPRVLQWAQNRTLAHFPSVHESQNLRPYWAEGAILHLRLLWGNDQLSGLVQWGSLVGSMAATSGIAAVLGGDKKTRWLTAVLTFSIPMGLLQSTTTQNDYVSAFWVVSLGFFVALSRVRQLSRLELLSLGISLGLGMLTKGTFFPFAVPLMLWYFAGRLADKQPRRAVFEGAVMVLIVIVLNGFFWTRNLLSTGGPYGPTNPLGILEKLISSPTILLDPLITAAPPYEEIPWSRLEQDHGGQRLSRRPMWKVSEELIQDSEADQRLAQLARMVAMNFVSPFSAFNQIYFPTLRSIPSLFPEHWVRSLEDAAWNHEDSAGSPIHFTLIAGSSVVLSVATLKRKNFFGLAYSAVLTGSFVLLSLIGFSGHVFGIRYQLGYLVLGMPLVAVALSRISRFWNAMVFGLLVYSLPYILLSNMRPVIGWTPWPTRVESVFSADKRDLLFAIAPELQDDYEQIADRIRSTDCQQVGLAYRRNNLEYATWYVLGAPQSGVYIEHVISLPTFSYQLDPAYAPCAVICTVCDALPERYRLPHNYDYGQIQLYLQTESSYVSPSRTG